MPRGQALLVGTGILLLASGLVHVLVWLILGALGALLVAGSYIRGVVSLARPTRA